MFRAGAVSDEDNLRGTGHAYFHSEDARLERAAGKDAGVWVGNVLNYRHGGLSPFATANMVRTGPEKTMVIVKGALTITESGDADKVDPVRSSLCR
ncbi:hypothetical protein EDC90_103824 [Martelella mediterranea]|uniref:Uncharacterized protein n=1 Tax=Martelella mediterranea TaxID=293089 RepID=A0A4R3NNQ6_9HYPH|nr:hypothetical protein EDC90_103824 [Martelella mediterranea]